MNSYSEEPGCDRFLVWVSFGLRRTEAPATQPADRQSPRRQKPAGRGGRPDSSPTSAPHSSITGPLQGLPRPSSTPDLSAKLL